jgi:hypothetical protein
MAACRRIIVARAAAEDRRASLAREPSSSTSIPGNGPAARILDRWPPPDRP